MVSDHASNAKLRLKAAQIDEVEDVMLQEHGLTGSEAPAASTATIAGQPLLLPGVA